MRQSIPRTPSILQRQKRALEAFVHDIQKKEPGPSEALIAYDLYGTAPLTAVLGFITELEADVLVRVHGRKASADLSYPLAGKERLRVIPIIGLYPDRETDVELKIGSKTYHYSLRAPGPIPNIPAYERLQAGQPQSLSFFLPADGVHLPCAFDASGDVRWISSLELSHRLHLSREGFILSGGPPALAPPNGPTELIWFDLCGRILRRLRHSGGFRSDFLELTDRRIVVIGDSPERGTVADRLLWFDPKNGQCVQELDIRQEVEAGKGSPAQSGSDWFMADSLRYNETSHELSLCGLAQGDCLRLDAATGRVLEHREGFSEPVGAIFDGDDLYLFESHRFDDHPPSLRRISSGADELLWQGEKTLFSPVFNDWELIDGGQARLHLGGSSDLEPAAAKKAPAAYSLFKDPDVRLWSQRIQIQGQKTQVLDRLATSSVHSLELPLAKARFGAPDFQVHDLGNWGKALEVDIPMAIEHEDGATDEMIEKIWADERRLYLQGCYFQGEVVMIVLRQAEHIRQYFIQTNRWPYGSAWLKSENDGIFRPVTWAVPIEDLTGDWELDLWVDETLFKSPWILKEADLS